MFYETEKYYWTKGIDRQYSDTKSTNAQQTKPKTNQKKNPPQNSKPLRSPCSNPNRQPIPVQNWTGEATAWKGKCIHLKQGCTGKYSEEGGSHPQPSQYEAEKCYSLSLRHTQMTFQCFPTRIGKEVSVPWERARPQLFNKGPCSSLHWFGAIIWLCVVMPVPVSPLLH